MTVVSDFGVISRHILPEETLYWYVPNLISSKTKVDTLITSPWFSYDCGEWCFALTVKNTICVSKFDSMHYHGNNDCMGLFLWRKRPGNMNYNITLKMMISPLTTGKSIDEICGQLDSFGGFGTYGFLSIDTLSRFKHQFSPTGRLKFICKIEKGKITEQILSVKEAKETGVEDKTLEESEESSNKNRSGEVSDLKGVDRQVENLKTLCLEGRHNDFVLRVDGREFPVHKGILGARSPVFAAMFEHDMVEKKEDCIDIPDCVAPAFEIFLLYVYTGHAKNLSQDNVFDVYYAADKYKVDDLKAECVEFMKSNLSISAFCNVTALSVRHDEKELLKVATSFFKENIKEIIKTVHWQKYLTENPIQANELLIKALDN